MENAKDIYKKIGNNIRLFRKEKEMSQEDLAYEARLNRAYIGYIERAERNPSIETVYKIAKTLKISLYKFFILGKEK